MFFLSEKDKSLSISGTSNNFLFMSLNSSKAVQNYYLHCDCSLDNSMLAN